MPKKYNLLTVSDYTYEDIRNAQSFSEAISIVLDINRWFVPQLAKYLKCSPKHIYCILKGKEDLSVDLALQLEKLTNICYLIWIGLYTGEHKIKEEV